MTGEKSSTRLTGILLCLVMFMICWQRIVLRHMLPCDGDTLRLVYPSWMVVRSALSHFHSLLWEPFRNMGQPLLASPPTETLYPLQWLSPFFDFVTYSKFFIAVHTALVVFYGLRLFRHFYHDELSSWFGAILLGFNGLMINKGSVHCDFASMSWTTACLYYFCVRRPIPLGICLALQWFGGLPTYSILTGLMMVVYTTISSEKIFYLRTLVMGGLVGLGLSAIQWIPFLELLHLSVRGVFLPTDMATHFSMSPIELLRGICVPAVFHSQLPSPPVSDPAVTGFFIGPIVFILFAWGAFRLTPLEKRIAVVSLIGFILALGQHIRIYDHIPFITIFRFPALWVVPATTGMIWVATGFLSTFKSTEIKKIFFLLALGDLAFYSCFPLMGYADATFITSTTLRPRALQSVPSGTRLFHSWNITSTVHRWQLRNTHDWYVFKGLLVPSIGVSYGLSEVESRSQLISRRHSDFLIRLNEAPLTSSLFAEARVSKIITLTPEGMSKPIPEPTDVRIIENSTLKPRAYMDSGAAVTIEHDDPGAIACSAQGPGRLVISESFFPGWRVAVNGKRHTVQPYDDTFLSVEIPSGESHVEFRYRPTSFLMGLLLSMVTIVAVGIYCLYDRNRHRYPTN